MLIGLASRIFSMTVRSALLSVGVAWVLVAFTDDPSSGCDRHQTRALAPTFLVQLTTARQLL